MGDFILRQTGRELQEAIDAVATKQDQITEENKLPVSLVSGVVNLIYPVGAIYLSTNEVSPATLFGGTWEQLKDKFLLGAGDSYTAGDTGGSATKTLSVTNLPSHSHTVSVSGTSGSSGSLSLSGTAAENGSHSHTFTGTAVDTDSKLGTHTHTINHGHGNTFNIESAGQHSHTQILTFYNGVTYSQEYIVKHNASGNQTSYYALDSRDNNVTTKSANYGEYAKTGTEASHSHVLNGAVSDYGGSSGASPSLAHIHSVTAAGTISSNGSHTHTVSVSGGSHTHTFEYNGNTGDTGSGTALDIMPPYLTVYMWKRTA